MNLATSIVTLVLITICISPFIIMGIKKVKNKKQKRQYLNQLANENNLKIGQNDVFGHFSIGMDSNNEQLFFYRNQNEHDNMAIAIKFSDIKSCFINKIGDKNSVKKIELCLHSNVKNQQDTNLIFFDNQTEFQLNGQLQLAEKWKNIIQRQLA